MENMIEVDKGLQRDVSAADSTSYVGVTGASLVCGVLWIAASVVVGSVMIRKVRLYVDAYRRRQYIDRYWQLCNQQYNQRFVQQYNQQYDEKDCDVLKHTCSANEQICGNREANIYSHTQQGNETDIHKVGDILYIHSETGGAKQSCCSDKQQDKQVDTGVHLSARRNVWEDTKTDMQLYSQQYMQSDEILSLSKQQQQQQRGQQQQEQILLPAREQDLILFQGADDLLLGSSFFSYLSMPRMIIEDADLQ